MGSGPATVSTAVYPLFAGSHCSLHAQYNQANFMGECWRNCLHLKFNMLHAAVHAKRAGIVGLSKAAIVSRCCLVYSALEAGRVSDVTRLIACNGCTTRLFSPVSSAPPDGLRQNARREKRLQSAATRMTRAVRKGGAGEDDSLTKEEQNALTEEMMCVEEPLYTRLPPSPRFPFPANILADYVPPAPHVTWIELLDVGVATVLPKKDWWVYIGEGKLMGAPLTSCLLLWRGEVTSSSSAKGSSSLLHGYKADESPHASSFPVTLTINRYKDVLVPSSPLLKAAGGSIPGLARVMASLHIVKHGPVGNVTKKEEDDEDVGGLGEEGRGEEDKESSSLKPTFIRTWHRTIEDEGVGRSKPIHVYGMEYTIEGEALDEETRVPLSADDITPDAQANGPPIHVSASLIMDENTGHVHEITFKARDDWWAELFGPEERGEEQGEGRGPESAVSKRKARRAKVLFGQPPSKARSNNSSSSVSGMVGLGPSLGFTAQDMLDATTVLTP
jgi:hypothetical protein